jgi:hypothetical protein
MKSGQRDIIRGRKEKAIRAEMTQRHIPRQIIIEQESVYMHDLRGSRKIITRLITNTWSAIVWTELRCLGIRRRISRQTVRLVASSYRPCPRVIVLLFRYSVTQLPV